MNAVVFVSFPNSIFGAVRTGSYMTYILMSKGLKQSVCDQGFYNGPVSKFWAYAFVLSKAPELGKSHLFLYLFTLEPQVTILDFHNFKLNCNFSQDR